MFYNNTNTKFNEATRRSAYVVEQCICTTCHNTGPNMQLVIRICYVKSHSIFCIQIMSIGPHVNLYIVEVWVLFVGYEIVDT
jgi:hypothetical protein